jgi:hypothetical protein
LLGALVIYFGPEDHGAHFGRSESAKA